MFTNRALFNTCSGEEWGSRGWKFSDNSRSWAGESRTRCRFLVPCFRCNHHCPAFLQASPFTFQQRGSVPAATGKRSIPKGSTSGGRGTCSRTPCSTSPPSPMGHPCSSCSFAGQVALYFAHSKALWLAVNEQKDWVLSEHSFMWA